MLGKWRQPARGGPRPRRRAPPTRPSGSCSAVGAMTRRPGCRCAAPRRAALAALRRRAGARRRRQDAVPRSTPPPRASPSARCAGHPDAADRVPRRERRGTARPRAASVRARGAGARRDARDRRPPGARSRCGSRPTATAWSRCEATRARGRAGDAASASRRREASATSASASAPTASTSAATRSRATSGRAPTSTGERQIITAFVPPWSIRFRDDATYFPMPWLLSTRGFGVLLDNTETSRFHLGQRSAPGRVERRGRRAAAAACASSRGRGPPTSCGASTERIGRQPAARAPVVLRPVVPDRPAQRGPAGARLPEAAAGRRRAGLGRRDPHALPAVRRSMPTAASTSATRTAVLPLARARDADLLPGEDLRVLHRAASTPPASATRSIAQRGRRALRLPGLHRRVDAADAADGAHRLHRPAGAGALRPAAARRRSRTATTAGWRTSASRCRPTAAPPTAPTGAQHHNAYPVGYHRAGQSFADRAPRPLARFVRSGLDRRAPVRADRLGRRPDDELGLRRPRSPR